MPSAPAAPSGLRLTLPATRDELPLVGSAHVRVSGAARAFPQAAPAGTATRAMVCRPASHRAAPPSPPGHRSRASRSWPSLALGQRNTSFSGMAFEGATPAHLHTPAGEGNPAHSQARRQTVSRRPTWHCAKRLTCSREESRTGIAESLPARRFSFPSGRWKAAVATQLDLEF